MKRLYKALLYLRIEFHWRFILHYRKRMKPLLLDGIPKPDSPEYAQVLRHDQKNARHCGRVTALTSQFLSI